MTKDKYTDPTCSTCHTVPVVIDLDYAVKNSVCWVTLECKCGKLTGPLNWLSANVVEEENQ